MTDPFGGFCAARDSVAPARSKSERRNFTLLRLHFSPKLPAGFKMSLDIVFSISAGTQSLVGPSVTRNRAYEAESNAGPERRDRPRRRHCLPSPRRGPESILGAKRCQGVSRVGTPARRRGGSVARPCSRADETNTQMAGAPHTRPRG